MLAIDDTRLPGLADLSRDRLRAITGADEVELLRLRYRPGNRAILHVATRTDAARNEGTVWFFAGDKGRRVARRNAASSRFDPETRALFEAFPDDHRMPQIRVFLESYQELLPRMTGRKAGAAPVLLRYRPGLSCTFRCVSDGQPPAFVKLINDDDPVRLRDANRAMQAALAGSGLAVVPALGIDVKLGAIAYGGAPGTPLDAALLEAGTPVPLEKAIAALRHLESAPLAPGCRMGPDMLLSRARESSDLVAVTAPSCFAATSAVVERLAASKPDEPLRPIHGDMKLEHLFLDGGRATLIDTENVSLGLVDYDLAQLYGRLWQAELDRQLPAPLVRAAAARVRAASGPSFDWCLGVVAVRLAKFHAQRPGPDTEAQIRTIMGRLL